MANPDPQNKKAIDDFKKNAYEQFNKTLKTSIAGAEKSESDNLEAVEKIRTQIQENLNASINQPVANYVVFQNQANRIYVTLRNVDSKSVDGYKACFESNSFEKCSQYINARLKNLVALAKDDSASVLRRAERNTRIRELVDELLERTTTESGKTDKTQL